MKWEKLIDTITDKGFDGAPNVDAVSEWLAENGHDPDNVIDSDGTEVPLTVSFADFAQRIESTLGAGMVERVTSAPDDVGYVTKDWPRGRRGWSAKSSSTSPKPWAVDAAMHEREQRRGRGGSRGGLGALTKGGAIDVPWFTKGADFSRDQLDDGGFESLYDLVRAKHFHDKGAPLDDRISKALSTYAQEGVGVDGGFLIPETIRYDLMEIERSSFPWMAGITRKTTETNNLSLPFPRDYVRNTGTVAGVDMEKGGEAGTIAQQKAVINMRSFKLKKRGAILPITNEHLEDAPPGAWSGVLESIVGEEVAYENALQVFEGNGTGEMKGFLNSSATLEVAKTGGQTADTVTYDNVKAMWEVLDARSESRAIWTVSKSCFSQFAAFAENSDSVWMPNSADTPGRLFGRPVYWLDHTSAVLGDRGDVTLWDPSAFCIVERAIRVDVSRDIFFEEDTTAYRYVYRADGSTIPTSTFTAGDGRTVAKFVVLAERA